MSEWRVRDYAEVLSPGSSITVDDVRILPPDVEAALAARRATLPPMSDYTITATYPDQSAEVLVSQFSASPDVRVEGNVVRVQNDGGATVAVFFGAKAVTVREGR